VGISGKSPSEVGLWIGVASYAKSSYTKAFFLHIHFSIISKILLGLEISCLKSL
jgi:hypothetical protein